MPTEQEVEAAALAIDPNIGPNAFDGRPYMAGSRIGKAVALARAALTAAEEVRGQVSEEDARAECARLGIDPDDNCADGGVDAWMVVASEMRNKALARRGAGQAVLDEAAIRADEREQLAKAMEEKAAEQYGLAREKTDGSFGGANVATYNGVTAASYLFASVAIRAAAPKPAAKP